MNDAADGPSKPTSDSSVWRRPGVGADGTYYDVWIESEEEEPELREISFEDLRRILENHRKWLTAEEGTAHYLRADLSGKQLEGGHRFSLQGAQLQGAWLRSAQLQKAHLGEAQLQGANLFKAQLQGAYFFKAQLQGANLHNAQLQGAGLREAQLQRAILLKAQLQRALLIEAKLQGANLSEAQLQGADLSEAQLQGANLSEAQLQGAILFKAQLREANLKGANFERLAVTKELALIEQMAAYPRTMEAAGGPGQERSADLTDADFRDADLSDAQLETVNGLRAEMLAGAVLTNAKLPGDIKMFDQLKHVEETSRNAITVFFGLLVASLYSWLTIATTTDVALITGTTSSPLPIINTNIALSGFYLAAPIILVAVYFYFHLYLERLWGDLASLPARFPDGLALDRKAYPWLLNGLVRAHFKNLELEERPLTRVENFVSIFLAWWVVPFTLLAFWLRFLPRHGWWVTTLHVVLITGAASFGVYSYRLAVQTLSRGATAAEDEKRGNQPLWLRIWRRVRRHLPSGMEATSAGLAIVMVLSAGTWFDPGDDLLTTLGSKLGYETYADLTDDDVSTKPSAWTGLEQNAEEEIAQVKGADLEHRDFRKADASGAFLVKANLAGAALRAANLTGANLSNANLTGADLTGADLGAANLTGADLTGAYLTGADLSPDFSHTQFPLALLRVVKEPKGDADHGVHVAALAALAARLTGVDKLTGVVKLTGANLSGADLSDADLSYANIALAKLTGANLTDANLAGADLTGADLRGASGVTQKQLDEACGEDDKTQLPEGLTLRTCPGTAPPVSPPIGSS